MENIYFRKATIEDSYFISTLFTNDEYEKTFADNDTTEEEWKDRFQYYTTYENFIIYNSLNDEKIG